jgi:hypothetical protein
LELLALTLIALIAIFLLLGLLCFIAAIRRLRRRRLIGGAVGALTALVLFLAAAGAGLIALDLRTYQRLTYEQPAGELQLTRSGEREFNAVLTYPSGEHAGFSLDGDDWQIDARVLKWHGIAEMLGFNAAYRLERISGRYSGIEDERRLPRSVYSLNPPERVDLWTLAHRYRSWVPWVDALYGSATYLPMADGALYQINVSQSGLIARPLNQAAREAVGSWH